MAPTCKCRQMFLVEGMLNLLGNPVSWGSNVAKVLDPYLKMRASEPGLGSLNLPGGLVSLGEESLQPLLANASKHSSWRAH